MGMFFYLKLGISFVLAFVGVKMLLVDTRFEIPVHFSLGVIFGVLAISIIISIVVGKKRSAVIQKIHIKERKGENL
jgi:tellurite resistance protein TerC